MQRVRIRSLAGSFWVQASHRGCLRQTSWLAENGLKFAPLFQRATTMKQFMWQLDHMRAAQILDAGVRRIQEIDPSNGSDIQLASLAGWLEQHNFLSCLFGYTLALSSYRLQQAV